MEEYGLKPCLGIETYQSFESALIHDKKQKDEDGCRLDQFHLILLAQNNTGLKNLWALNTYSHSPDRFYYHGRADWELLEKYNEGIICTSACASSLLGQLLLHDRPYEEVLSKYLNIFKDRFYLEIGTYAEQFQYDLNDKLISIANDYSIPLVVSTDAHYSTQDQYELHEATLAVQFNDKLENKESFYHMPCLYIMDEIEIQNYLYDIDQLDEAIENNKQIIKNINTTLPTYRKRTPVFIPEKHLDSWNMFFDLVQEGFEKKVVEKGLNQGKYFQRLKHELEVIQEAELYDYFLIVRDYIVWAKKNKIQVGPARGSSAGCLCLYLIDVTEVDPVKYGLIFERFYNRGRGKHMPDIDTDFSTVGKDLVYNYIAKKYGKQHVAHLGTNITLKGKGAINDLGRIMSIPPFEVEKINQIIEETVDAGIQADWQKINAQVGNQLAPYKSKYPQLFEWAEQLYEHLRAYGVHASGVIVGDEPLAENFPLRWSTKEQELVTQWPMEIAEDFGYMKMDLLGLRNLDTLQELDSILVQQGKERINWQEIDSESCPIEMWELLDKGMTTGIFQIEEGVQAKNMAKRMKPRSIEDLSLLVALNRPGPDSEAYLKIREGKAEPIYDNDIAIEVTKDTLGIWVYQEQLIQFLTKIGYSLEEADEFRAIMGKKKLKEVEQAGNRFLTWATNSGLDIRDANRMWRKFEKFSKYGFNASHAISYGIITFRTLYALYHYPAEFILACIRTVDKPRLPMYFAAANRIGINIHKPNVNRSKVETQLVNSDIQFGLRDIKYIGKNTAKWLVENGPFKSKQDLIDKSKEENRKIILPSGIKKVAINSRQINILEQIGALSEIEEWTPLEEVDQVALEREYLGFPFSDTSAMILEEYFQEKDYLTPINTIEQNGIYILAAIVDEIDYRKTKTGPNAGKQYAKVKVRDNSGDMSIFVWNDELKNLQLLWRRNLIGEFKIKKNDRGSSLQSVKVISE